MTNTITDIPDRNTTSTTTTTTTTTTSSSSNESTSSSSSKNTNNDTTKEEDEPPNNEGCIRPSIRIHMIRHAESQNNQVYRDARFIYRGGTSDFDGTGWNHYIDKHRKADPSISSIGQHQSKLLAENYLIPHLYNQSSFPIHFIISPMKRTIDTIRPTINGLLLLQKEQQQQQQKEQQQHHHHHQPVCDVTINGFYFESEGCHKNNIAEEGMSPKEVKEYLFRAEDAISGESSSTDQVGTTENQQQQQKQNRNNDNGIESDNNSNTNTTIEQYYKFTCAGFPDPERGWYCNGTSNETREESELRASKFYCWLCDHLDSQLLLVEQADDLFDAGVTIDGESYEDDHDKVSHRIRRRRTAVLVGHGDFMSLVLQRIITGYGHSVESTGVPHRSAFVHWNTGITELEYFGHGRFLVMSQNATPHFIPKDYPLYRTGGSLKDGWSYIMPHDKFVLSDTEVTVTFSDEIIPAHIESQSRALRELYLPASTTLLRRISSANLINGNVLSVQDDDDDSNNNNEDTTSNGSNGEDGSISNNNNTTKKDHVKHFIVKRGLQVVAVATYSDTTGKLYDVAIRPTAGNDAGQLLIKAVQKYAATKFGRSGSLYIVPRSNESETLLLQSLESSDILTTTATDLTELSSTD